MNPIRFFQVLGIGMLRHQRGCKEKLTEKIDVAEGGRVYVSVIENIVDLRLPSSLKVGKTRLPRWLQVVPKLGGTKSVTDEIRTCQEDRRRHTQISIMSRAFV